MHIKKGTMSMVHGPRCDVSSQQRAGIEPRPLGPKSGILPLDYRRLYGTLWFGNAILPLGRGRGGGCHTECRGRPLTWVHTACRVLPAAWSARSLLTLYHAEPLGVYQHHRVGMMQ